MLACRLPAVCTEDLRNSVLLFGCQINRRITLPSSRLVINGTARVCVKLGWDFKCHHQGWWCANALSAYSATLTSDNVSILYDALYWNIKQGGVFIWTHTNLESYTSAWEHILLYTEFKNTTFFYDKKVTVHANWTQYPENIGGTSQLLAPNTQLLLKGYGPSQPHMDWCLWPPKEQIRIFRFGTHSKILPVAPKMPSSTSLQAFHNIP